MVECKSTPRTAYQRLREDQCCEPHDKCENGRVSVLSRWQQMVKNILIYAGANGPKYDKYEPVLLGGGSFMFVRCDPEAIFREGK